MFLSTILPFSRLFLFALAAAFWHFLEQKELRHLYVVMYGLPHHVHDLRSGSKSSCSLVVMVLSAVLYLHLYEQNIDLRVLLKNSRPQLEHLQI